MSALKTVRKIEDAPIFPFFFFRKKALFRALSQPEAVEEVLLSFAAGTMGLDSEIKYAYNMFRTH